MPCIVSLAAAQAQNARVQVLNRAGNVLERLTDGGEVRLKVISSSRVGEATRVSFALDTAEAVITDCTVQAGSDTCRSDPVLSLGWYWNEQGRPQPTRRVVATSALFEGASDSFRVAPRPVVLVHGLASNAGTWSGYVGPDGFLASLGLRGFAVGDGQVEGMLNTGSLEAPTRPTNTIAQNAAILGTYITGVKRATGAEQVDLVAHSLGGLIARYYIARLMPTRDVAQLITLGTPHAGTDCANLVASLGFYLPASLELRTSYISEIFNRQISRRAGVPFYLLAGTRIVEAIQSPCSSVPNDLVVGAQSVFAIHAPAFEARLLHTDLTRSAQIFDGFVRPRLITTAGSFPNEPDSTPDLPPQPPLQFARIFAGHVDKGASVTQVVRIDRAAVASFALFDPTRSLTVIVRGATGAIIPLSAAANGLIAVNDPETLVHLSYGFRNPRPGPWEITLSATDKTPSEGADYALTAQLVGGAVLRTQTSTLLPTVGDTVVLSANLELAGQSLPIRDAQAVVRSADGVAQHVHFAASDSHYTTSWRPSAPGIQTIDVTVTGSAPDGTTIDRQAFLSVEVPPTVEQVHRRQTLLFAALALILATIFGTAWVWRRTKR
jgi:pimeloyl-ACP methyl ester carboxylesterase